MGNDESVTSVCLWLNVEITAMRKFLWKHDEILKPLAFRCFLFGHNIVAGFEEPQDPRHRAVTEQINTILALIVTSHSIAQNVDKQTNARDIDNRFKERKSLNRVTTNSLLQDHLI